MDSLNLPQSLLSEIVTKKIPIPQSAGNGHYKKFSELYGTPESLIQYPLPRTSTQMANDRKKKLRLPFKANKNRIKNWITCVSCDKPRAVFTQKMIKKAEIHLKHQLSKYLEDLHFVCGEALIPPEDPEFNDLRNKFVTVDRTKTCESSIETFYYQEEDNPLICGWCCESLSAKNVRKYQGYKLSYESVIPNCGKINCVSLNTKSEFQGWTLKGKPIGRSKKKRFEKKTRFA